VGRVITRAYVDGFWIWTFSFGEELWTMGGMAFADPRVAFFCGGKSCCCAKACRRKDAHMARIHAQPIVGTWKDERNDNTIWTTDLQLGRFISMFLFSFLSSLVRRQRKARSSSWDSEHRREFFECEDGGISTSRGFAEVPVPERLCWVL
jgi:hypothetical protein